MVRERIYLLVRGRVQGVAFRAYTRDEAKALGLTGYVRNLPDGRVEILAEGERGKLEMLSEWAYSGSPSSRVDEVLKKLSSASGEFSDFQVKF